jgi:hypothetical protein
MRDVGVVWGVLILVTAEVDGFLLKEDVGVGLNAVFEGDGAEEGVVGTRQEGR